MPSKIILKKSNVVTDDIPKAPSSSDLDFGELAINYAAGRLYFKKSDGAIDYFTSSSQTVAGVSSVDGNTGAISSAQLLTAIKKEDGSGSGLDADLLDGLNTSSTNSASTVMIRDASGLTGIGGINLDTAYTGGSAIGRINWDSGEGTATIGLVGGNVNLAVGQENVVRVYNGTASPLTDGTIVAVSGAQGQRPSVILADADSEALSAATLGMVTEPIAAGAEGFVTTFGVIKGLNTLGFTEGAPIYLSQTSGQFTTTRPLAPAHTVFLGWVIRAHETSGQVFLNISNGWELDELHNVRINSVQNNDFLRYDSTNQYWKNVAITTDGISEGTTNLYYTDSRARNAISVTQNLSYNSSTGVITGPGTASSSALGLVKLGSDTSQSTAANSVTSTASRTYAIQNNASGQLVVNVPWVDTDTNTTYTLDGSGTTNSVNIELIAGGSGSGTDSINVVGSGGTTVAWDEGNQRITINSANVAVTYSRKTANYTAVSGDLLIADTSGGAFTITLPASPTTGQFVKIADGNDWGTTPVTVARNSSTIEGLTEDITLDVKGITVEFVYDGTTWEVFANTGPAELPSQTGNSGKFLTTNGTSTSWATVASGVTISDDTTTNASYYPQFVTSTSGTLTSTLVSSTKLYYNPSTGQLNATNFNSLSDLNKKTNVVTLDNALDKVSAIRGVSFKWKDTGAKSLGVIAQELEPIVPELVSTNDKGEKSVNYDGIISLLVESIKTLKAEIEELKKGR